MCEQILQYDCGHLQRRARPCSKPRKRRSSLQCFSSASSDSECEKPKKFERRASLCRSCLSQGRDKEVYQNAPRHEPERKKAPVNKVCAKNPDAGIRSHDQVFPPRLRRVREADFSLRGEYKRLESPQPSGFEASRVNGPRPSNIATSRQAVYGGQPPMPAVTARSVNSQTALLSSRNHYQASSCPRSASLRRDVSVKKLKQDIRTGLHIQRKASDESFVCSTARRIENSG